MSYPMHQMKFSKSRLLIELRDRWTMLKNLHKFSPMHGTAQFNNIPTGDKRDELLRMYGEWRGIETLIDMIDSGQLGTHPEKRKLSSIALSSGSVLIQQEVRDWMRNLVGLHTVTKEGEMWNRIAPGRGIDPSLTCTRLGIVVWDEGEWIPSK